MKADLQRWLDGAHGKRIVIWGDLVVDHTIYGDTSRISREAPVLILEKEWDSVSAGCAGNAVMNVAALGGVPLPVGILGQDEMGLRLREEFQIRGIDTSFIQMRGSSETAIKMRVLAGGLHTVKQQVIRIDSNGDYRKVADDRLQRLLQSALKGADAVIISDYGLGTVRPQLFARLIRRRTIPSVIDSRHSLRDFRGASSATPNEPELENVANLAIGDDEAVLDRAGRQLLRELDLQALLVTRGGRGMALFEPRKRRLDIPVSRVQEIVDVTGAGDTVIATYTIALAAGASFEQAARLANLTAGLAVMRRGAAAPTAGEVRQALGEVALLEGG